MNSNYYTDFLEEKIYTANSENEINVINESVIKFFSEMLKRKRDDSIEGGLQLAAVIYKDSYAAKVNEEDGFGTHLESLINLTRFLMKKGNFFSEQGMRQFELLEDDIRTITAKGIEIRMMCNSSELTIFFHTKNDIKSEFEVEVIKSFAKCCQHAIENGYLKNIGFYLKTLTTTLEINEWNDLSYDEIEENLNESFLNNNSKHL